MFWISIRISGNGLAREPRVVLVASLLLKKGLPLPRDGSHDNDKPGSRRGGVFVRMTPEDFERLDAECARSGLSRAGVLRTAWERSPGVRSRRTPSAAVAELKRLLGQIGRLGGLVNQIAAKLNKGEFVSASAIQEAAQDVAEMRMAVLKALGLKP